MRSMEAIELSITCGITGFLLTLYAIFIIMFLKNANTPQIKPKAPKILLTSAVGNVLSLFAATVLMICSIFRHHQNYYYVSNVCIGVSEGVCAPLMLYSYLFRIIQLKRIFTISNEEHKRAITNSLWFKQKTYIIIAGGIFGLSLILISVLISHCLNDKDNEYEFHPLLIAVTMTVNFVCTFLSSLNGIMVLMSEMYSTKIKTEVLFLVSFWASCAFAFYLLILRLNETNYIKHELFTIAVPPGILIIRSLVSFILSIMAPVMQYHVEVITPFGETRECVSSVEMALSSELPFLYFFEFIESVDGANGKSVINLYIEIKLYEDMVMNAEDGSKAAKEILRDYLEPTGESSVKGIPEKVKDMTKTRISSGEMEVHLFDRVYSVVMLKLEKYFVLFKNSLLYKSLLRELKNTEIIYERLINSELI
eukprot:TRINITY_DN15063_c0_g2_i5.p1 TRINITY_DN15063_c0_g2~~TRINITY_DN15063_c0_g2_i5.p1  ORF type:complete len:423 (+),score=116.55 TRINITY_DN15063_c0_g2_i5:152-1420(+)